MKITKQYTDTRLFVHITRSQMTFIDSTFIFCFAEVPDEDPVLRSDVQKVSPGAIIKANCTTPSSYPQMNVTWFINGAEVGSIFTSICSNVSYYYVCFEFTK